ncbi:MAG: recombinase family protein [Acidobacteriota bacterium]
MPRSRKIDDAPITGAVCYTRVSTEEQASIGVSLAAQEERLRAYCLMTGLDIARFIREEGVSAAKPLGARPGGVQMLDLICQKKIGHVVALKLDRLFRDAEDALHQTKAWDRSGIALHLVDMGGQTLNTASATGRFFLNVMAGFAELERNLISERTAAAMAHKKIHREAYGTTPFGFVRIGDQLIEDLKELEIIDQIRSWRGDGWSLRRIAAELSKLGVPTKEGGQWFASTVRYLLQNDLYKKRI